MMTTNAASFIKKRVASFSKKVWLVLPVSAFALSACVTINIYFPAAAAEKAADKIIEEVWQQSAKPVVKEKK